MVMCENPYIDKKEEVMTYIYALESNKFAKTAAKKKDRINALEETVDCKVCRKKQKSGTVPTSVVTAGYLGATSQTSASKLFHNSDKEEETRQPEKKTDPSPDHFPEVGNQDTGTEENITDRNPTLGE